MRDDQPNRYFDPHFKIETAKILPGEYYATNKDMALVTVLGSCVSACLRDSEAHEVVVRRVRRHARRSDSSASRHPARSHNELMTSAGS